MTKEELIKNLKYTMEKHKNDNVDTFGTNISLMCKDILEYLEQQTSDDCVSRQATLNAIIKELCIKDESYLLQSEKAIYNVVKNIPPVTPTHGTCKDCCHRDPEDKKCDCGHDIIWQLPREDDWYCADYEKRGSENDI